MPISNYGWRGLPESGMYLYELPHRHNVGQVLPKGTSYSARALVNNEWTTVHTSESYLECQKAVCETLGIKMILPNRREPVNCLEGNPRWVLLPSGEATWHGRAYTGFNLKNGASDIIGSAVPQTMNEYVLTCEMDGKVETIVERIIGEDAALSGVEYHLATEIASA